MGINDEYSRDAYNYDGEAYDSEGSDEFDPELHPEDWQDMYSQELLDGWMHLRNYLEHNYIKCRAGYPQFVELVLDPSKWYTNSEPGYVQTDLWNSISKLPVISDRVVPQNFYAWVENYVDYL
jgi:hypothetical protein